MRRTARRVWPPIPVTSRLGEFPTEKLRCNHDSGNFKDKPTFSANATRREKRRRPNIVAIGKNLMKLKSNIWMLTQMMMTMMTPI